jgi:glycosyltransferase involved in cell wall biosynthesis
LLVWYGNFIRRAADRIIVTDERRFELLGSNRSKAITIGNFPEDPGDVVTSIIPTGKTKIYVSGTLLLSRGLKEILACIECVDDVEIISAGWLYDSFAKDTFVKHPKVTYMGIVSGKESLHLAAQCDAIYSFYAPTSINNIYASPNKIYDALSVGRPVIINSETVVANWVIQHKYGWSCCYDDVSALTQILNKIKEGRSGLPSFIHRTRSDFKGKYSWQQMESLLVAFYNDL